MLSCLHPRVVKNKYTNEYVTVPCRKCAACTSLASSNWSLRLELESQSHAFTLFGTLTYDDAHLPVKDISSVTCDSKTWDDSVSKSSEYIALRKGLIPCINIADSQRFIKNLRGYIRQLNINNEKYGHLRYFIAWEYGPTTFRPHMHLLLWFDSPELSLRIKEFVFKAWQFATSFSTPSQFFKRNRFSFVRLTASQYVAGYLNCDSKLPAILREPPFRTKHLQSTRPVIGSSAIQLNQIREFVFGSATSVGIKKPKSHKVVDVSLWRSFENRFFPRFARFDSLSVSDRIALFRTVIRSKQTETLPIFESWVRSKWCSDSTDSDLLRFVLSDTSELSPESGYRVPSFNRIKTLRSFVRNVCQLSDTFGISSDEYIYRISSYYVRKNYHALCNQLTFQENAVVTPNIPNTGLKYLPHLIDLQFYENLRQIPSEHFNLICEGFGLINGLPLFDYSLFNSFDYQHSKSFYERIRSDNTKTRLKKDFVSSHPEYQKIYLQNLFSNL